MTYGLTWINLLEATLLCTEDQIIALVPVFDSVRFCLVSTSKTKLLLNFRNNLLRIKWDDLTSDILTIMISKFCNILAIKPTSITAVSWHTVCSEEMLPGIVSIDSLNHHFLTSDKQSSHRSTYCRHGMHCSSCWCQMTCYRTC